jgi:uncharacterized repeat protein (TIGR02543 family)
MFSSASSFARKFSLAIVVTLFVSLQVPAASATTAIPEDGFYDCATGVKRADSNATGFRIENGNVSNIDCTGAVVLPSGLTEIDDMAFYLSAITSITIPSGVTSIGEAAFEGSSSLSQVVLPPTLESIGWYAFGYNTSLTSITIPASVTYITDEAFYDSSIEDFYFLGNAPGYVANYAFDSVAAGAKAHITATATGFGTEPTWKGLIVESSPNYSYEFIERGGSIVHGGTFTAGGSIQTPPQSERAGYTFMGWAATLGGSALSFPYSPGVNQGIILYALWSAKTHTVTFDSLGGSAVTEQTFVTDGTVSEPTPPTRSGYTFEGWADSAGSALSFPYTPSNPQDLTLYAQWSADSHTVTFNSMGGSPIAADSFSSGGSINNSASPSSNQFFNDALPEDAYFVQLPIQVHLGNEVSTSESGWVKQVRYYRSSGDDSAISASVWSSEGVLLGTQLFAGVSESGWQSVTLDEPVYISANETFYVSVLTPSTPYVVGATNVQSNSGPWSLIGYKASGPEDSFVPIDGAEGVFTLVDLVFETASVPTPTRAGYTFLGWSATDGGSVISFPYTPGVTEDITLYANWSVNSYLVSFDTKGGEAFPGTSFITGGYVDEPFEAPYWGRPYRDGYTFLGWSATDGGSAISFPYDPGVTSNIILYALWSADSHSILFFANGSYVHYLSYLTDGSVAEPTQPTRAGYTFLGWSATDGGSAVSFPYAPGGTGSKTMYALWSINTYSITFNSKGGTSVAAGSFVYGGQTASAPAAPTRTGYVFAGWSDTDGGSAISFPYSPSVASNVTLYAKWTSLPPVMGRTSATTLLPGDLVSLNVSRVTKGCTITVGWAESNTGVTPVSKVVKADRSTGAFTIASPATAGTYTLSTNLISSECAGGSAVTLTQSVVVGKSLNLTAKVSTSSAYVSKNPTLTLSGSVKSGSVAVVGKQFTVSLRRNGVDVETVTATTSSSGVMNVTFTRVTYSGGAYTVDISSAADTTYLATTFTTAKLTLRGQGYNAI